MHGAKFYHGDELFISIKTDEDVKDLRDYLDVYLRIKSKNTSSANGTDHAPVRIVQTLTQSGTTGRRQVTLDKYCLALKVLGGTGTSEEIYHKMLELGHTFTAQHPRNAVGTYLRQETNYFKKVGVRENGAVVFALIDEKEREGLFEEE